MQSLTWIEGLTFKRAEAHLLKSALEIHKYNIAQVALALGVSRATVYKKVIDNFNVSVMDMKKAYKLALAEKRALQTVTVA